MDAGIASYAGAVGARVACGVGSDAAKAAAMVVDDVEAVAVQRRDGVGADQLRARDVADGGELHRATHRRDIEDFDAVRMVAAVVDRRVQVRAPVVRGARPVSEGA